MQAAQPELKEIKRTLSEVRQNVIPINLDEEIRRRAYELWGTTPDTNPDTRMSTADGEQEIAGPLQRAAPAFRVTLGSLT